MLCPVQHMQITVNGVPLCANGVCTYVHTHIHICICMHACACVEYVKGDSLQFFAVTLVVVVA